MERHKKTRLFLVLFSLGFLGVASLVLIDVSAIIALIPGIDAPTMPPALLKLLSLVQPSVILALAVVIGVALAPRVGLSAPAAEAVASGGDVFKPLKSQFAPGVLGGLAGGICIVLISLISRQFLSAPVVDRIAKFSAVVPFPTRILYGGITEELLLRWGFMTLIVWAASRVLQKNQNHPRGGFFVGAILVSSLVFGAGHLPVAYVLLPEFFNGALVLFVIFANSAFGLIAGYLYWKRGLESAMIAHIFCHLLLALASWTGAYF